VYIQMTMNCHLSDDELAEQGSSDAQQTYHTKQNVLLVLSAM